MASFSQPFPINSAAPFKLDNELSSVFVPNTSLKEIVNLTRENYKELEEIKKERAIKLL